MAPCFRVAVSMSLANLSNDERKKIGDAVGVRIKADMTRSEAIKVLKAVLGDCYPVLRERFLTGRGYHNACVFIGEAMRIYTGVESTPEEVDAMFVRGSSHQGMVLTEKGKDFLKGKAWPPVAKLE